MITQPERERFDAIVESVIADLPSRYTEQLEGLPLVVLDRPTGQTLTELGIDPADEPAVLEMCGLHTGIAITARSVEDSAQLPPEIQLYREGILELSGGFDRKSGDADLRHQVRITILHEIGHQFGLDEDDLFELGYY